MYFDIALLGYMIDRFIGEFPIKHPVMYMGDFIKWYENRFYKNDIRRGALLAIFLLNITLFIVSIVEGFASFFGELQYIILALFASTTIAHKMLYDSVKGVLYANNPKEAISMLVSRDTKDLSDSDINKASIETYSENLSDGVIAPLFYLVIFGLKGAFIYKAINTLDSMIGYRNEKYEKFGKFSAILDDIANYIPSRITALLIAILFVSKKAFIYAIKYGKLHDSPNAGYPISAMAGAIDVRLGGNTSYFGKIKEKPYFGDGKKIIEKEDVKKALNIRNRLDIFLIILLTIGIII